MNGLNNAVSGLASSLTTKEDVDEVKHFLKFFHSLVIPKYHGQEYTYENHVVAMNMYYILYFISSWRNF